MIRNSPRNRTHRDKTPYRRVNVPSEIIEQLDTLVGGSNGPPRASGSSSAVNESPRRGDGATKKDRDKRVVFSSPSPIAARHTRATGGQSTSDQIQVPVDSGGSGALRNTVVTAEVSEDEDAIMEAAYRIAIEPGVSIPEGSKCNPSPDPVGDLVPAKFRPRNESTIHHVQPPSSLENDFASPLGQPSSPSRPGRDTLIPRQSDAMNISVEQLRLDLREVFDDFLARATAVMDQHLGKLQ